MRNEEKEFRVTGFELPVTSCRLPVAGYQFRMPSMISVVILFTLLSCGTPLPKMDGIDLTAWKNDKNGCTGIREKMTELVIQQKDKLLSLTETDIVSLLGKPDETELYKRNEKFYKYYFTNGPGCAGAATRKSITLRFNAMGLLKEAVVD